MELTYRTLTDEEFRTIQARAHAMRAEATREMLEAIGVFAKSRFGAVKDVFSQPARKTA